MGYYWGISERNKRISLETKVRRLRKFLVDEFLQDIKEDIRREIEEETEKRIESKVIKNLSRFLSEFFSEFVPRREVTVKRLFYRFYKELGFEKCHTSLHKKGDCICIYGNKEIVIEFEKTALDFIRHKHDASKIDLIVCWIDNLKNKNDFSVPILELSKEIPKILEKPENGA